MSLPPRFTHIMHLQLDTAVPFRDRDLEGWVRDTLSAQVQRTSVESPLRDVQNVIVERVTTAQIKAAAVTK